MPFTHLSKPIHTVCTLNRLELLASVLEQAVSMYVKAVIAINLQKAGELPHEKPSWAYSIIKDSAANRNDPYIDVCILVCGAAAILSI